MRPGSSAGLEIRACGEWGGLGGMRTGAGMWGADAAAALGPGVRRDTHSFSCGADDAAVETAEEAKEPAEADITELCRDMFSKMATYLTGELTGEAGSGLFRVVRRIVRRSSRWRCGLAWGDPGGVSASSVCSPLHNPTCPETCLLEVWGHHE